MLYSQHKLLLLDLYKINFPNNIAAACEDILQNKWNWTELIKLQKVPLLY